MKKAVAPGVLLAVQIAGVFCLTHLVTYVGRHFIFEARYLWHMTIALCGALGVAVTYYPVSLRNTVSTLQLFKRAVFPAAFGLVCAVQVFNAGMYAASGVLAHNPPPVLHTPLTDPTFIWRIPRNHALRLGYVYRPPARLSDGTVIVPPFGPFWWQKGADEDVRNFMWVLGQRSFAPFENVSAEDPRRTADPRPTLTYGNTVLRLFENMPPIKDDSGRVCPPACY